MKAPFDVVIISSDTDPKFLDFWPYVERGWKRLYPELVVRLVVVAPNSCAVPNNASWLAQLPDIPAANQTKLARYWEASRYPAGCVCSINDIDLIPINRHYIDQFLSTRPNGTLVRMGAELYSGVESGKATSGYLTAESEIWKRLTNAKDMAWAEWVRQFVGFKKFDHKEDVANALYYEDPNCFSDESWLRAMLSVNPVPVLDRYRGYYPYTTRALCRSDWQWKPDLIQNGTIVEAHLPRPLVQHRDKLDPLFKLLGIA